MTHTDDPILHELAKKKKALLNQLLSLSIQSAIDEYTPETGALGREQLMDALAINERALESRENDLGIKAGRQEAKIFHEIGNILVAIQDNNKQAVEKLEKEMKLVEGERSRLLRGNKLSGYISQQKSYQNSMSTVSNAATQQTGKRLLNGTL